jgi:hypothetical protein
MKKFSENILTGRQILLSLFYVTSVQEDVSLGRQGTAKKYS